MIIDTLNNKFGFSAFREGQEEVVTNIVEGRSSAAIFPTGSGKSLCYQLSALHLPHLTIVISPLLALIQDQIDYMQSIEIDAVRIDSTLDRNQERDIMDGIRKGRHKILMISVERFKNERFRNFLSSIEISLMVIDEAHCISEWGHNFRPDYLKLPIFREEFNIKQVLLLTATATPKVVDDMCDKFNLNKKDIILTGFYRKNLKLIIKPVSISNKGQQLVDLFKEEANSPSIIYVTQQKTAENIANYLCGKGIKALAYHAGLGNEKREEIQNSFMSGQTNCIVATIAFGMGIDKKDIRRVIHYDLPKSIENYSQEIGRAGRDGNKSDCILLANASNVNVLENFVFGDTPELSAINTILNKIPFHAENWEIKISKLSSSTNIRLLPLKTLLVYLEMKGIIKPAFSYFASYRFSNILSEDDITSKFKGEKQDFIKGIFKASKKARKWTTVDFKAVYEENKSPRDRVVNALEYLDEKGYLQLEAKEMMESYTICKKEDEINIEILAKELYESFKEKELSEVQRIQKMIAFFESDKCLSVQLASYFGEELPFTECGHCSVCKSGKIDMPREHNLVDLSSMDCNEHCKEFITLFKEIPSYDLTTRFLCGITVPCFKGLKVNKLSAHASLESYSYMDVKTWLESNLLYHEIIN